MNMKILIAQINPTVGDLIGNLSIIKQSILEAIQGRCDVVAFPELATVGYPPRDLLYSSALWVAHAEHIDRLLFFLRQQNRQITVIVGGLHEEMQSSGRYARYNAAWILDKHFGKRVVHKRLLPCYDVFDETRYFVSGIDEPYLPIPIYVATDRKTPCLVPCDVLICEDIWNNEHQCGTGGGADWMKPATYEVDPVAGILRQHGKHAGDQGPLFVLNGSPFWVGKIEETKRLVERICERLDRPVVWVNQIGAHDEIITGGYSMVSLPPGPSGGVATRMAKPFQEDRMIVRLDDSYTKHSNLNKGRDFYAPLLDAALEGDPVQSSDFEMWTIYKALFMHMTDYKRRCGFKRVVLGLSGGIDSAVVAVVAAKVFGPSNVTGIAMPSPYSSEGSIEDARTLAEALRINFEVKSITDVYHASKNLFLTGGKQAFSRDVTDENLQPRLRGLILMAHSNEYDPCLLLTTGNKSEISVGYFTVGGDSLGGLAVISDLWKTQVYQLANFMNVYLKGPIPEATINKPPSAELKPDQEDTDSLPPYDVLDPMLKMFVEEGKSIIEVKLAFPDVDVVRVFRMHINSEFKRGQLCIGPKLSVRAYGAGRRMPVACKRTLELFPTLGT